MSNLSSSQANITVGVQYRGTLEIVLSSLPITLPCFVFLFINGTMLFTLRSKPVFRETSRYVLLYNLLFADTVLLAHSQFMYLLAAFRITLTYPVCGVLNILGNLTNVISPLTLVVMSLERYVAVCYPLRHATIITIRNTGLAIFVVWAFSSLNALIHFFLLLHFSAEYLENQQMKKVCSSTALSQSPVSDFYEKAYTYSTFVSACVVVIFSYIGVMVAARSASTGKSSARKARNTLLLHLVQLGLSVSSTIHNPLVAAIMTKNIDKIAILRMLSIFYLSMILLPRCLSALIYGIRDRIIRPILIYNLCCHLKGSVVQTKAKVTA